MQTEHTAPTVAGVVGQFLLGAVTLLGYLVGAGFVLASMAFCYGLLRVVTGWDDWALYLVVVGGWIATGAVGATVVGTALRRRDAVASHRGRARAR